MQENKIYREFKFNPSKLITVIKTTNRQQECYWIVMIEDGNQSAVSSGATRKDAIKKVRVRWKLETDPDFRATMERLTPSRHFSLKTPLKAGGGHDYRGRR